MKRILPAALLAVLLHGVFLTADVGWLLEKKMILPKSTAVTVTMSYRQPETEPVPATKKPPIKKPKIRPKVAVKKPDKLPEPNPPEEEVKIPDEPPPVDETEEPDDPAEPEDMVPHEEDVFEEDTHGEAVSNMQVVREAYPLYKRNPPPRYPRVARKRGYQGTVVLSVLVDESGRVKNLWVFTSSGYRLLDNAAVKAVRKWAFEPGLKGDKRLAMWVNVPIRFQLK